MHVSRAGETSINKPQSTEIMKWKLKQLAYDIQECSCEGSTISTPCWRNQTKMEIKLIDKEPETAIKEIRTNNQGRDSSCSIVSEYINHAKN